MAIIFNQNGPNILYVIELNLRVKTHEEVSVEVARSARRKAHTRSVQTRLEHPVLEGVLKFTTTSSLAPGKVYSDQNGILYVAQSENIFVNTDRHLNIQKYDLPTMLIQVASAHIESRKQFSL